MTSMFMNENNHLEIKNPYNYRFTVNLFCRYYISLLITFVDSDAPPRPPLPAEMVGGMVGKMSGSKMGHNDTTTDDESEEIFHKAPTPSQGPIMVRIVNLPLRYC